MKACITQKDVPTCKHYGIVTFGKIAIPGDERSRTNPGHGYPEHTEHTATYSAYDKEAWKNEIIRMTERKHYDFVAFVAYPAKVKTISTIEIENE